MAPPVLLPLSLVTVLPLGNALQRLHLSGRDTSAHAIHLVRVLDNCRGRRLALKLLYKAQNTEYAVLGIMQRTTSVANKAPLLFSIMYADITRRG
jgi:hypothetical protein